MTEAEWRTAIEAILWHVLKPEAFERWWNTKMFSNGVLTPNDLMWQKKYDVLLQHVVGYLDPSFS